MIARIAREPLTHFLLIGLVIFVSATAIKATQKPVVRVDADELQQLASYWELQMQRPPTREELKGIIGERIDEEILAREAQREGLDKNDLIIRRRLAQKMAFASEDTTPIPEPDEATLKSLYARSAGLYVTPAHLALQQVYFSADRGEGPARAAAEAALARLRDGAGEATGDPLVLPLAYADVTLPELIRDYGDGYAHFADTAPVGEWAGPVRSAYGWHVLRIERRTPATPIPFAEARAQVRDAWVTEQRQTANAALMDRLRKRYRIEITGGAG